MRAGLLPKVHKRSHGGKRSFQQTVLSTHDTHRQNKVDLNDTPQHTQKLTHDGSKPITLSINQKL